jgi:hypothetical protein
MGLAPALYSDVGDNVPEPATQKAPLIEIVKIGAPSPLISRSRSSNLHSNLLM